MATGTLGFVVSGGHEPPKGDRPARPRGDRSVTRLLELLRRVGEWAGTRRDHVSACYVAPGSGGVRLHVIGTSEEYDFKLSSEMAELARELDAKGLFVTPTLVPAGPPEELGTFFNPEEAIQLIFR